MGRRLTAIAVACALGAATSWAEVIERIVAKVNGQIITKSQLDIEYQTVVERLGPAPSPEEDERRRTELRPQVLDQMVGNILVLQVAEERGLQVPPRYFEEWKTDLMKQMSIESEEEFLRQVELQGMTPETLQKNFEEGLLVQEIRRMEVDNKISVTEEEIGKHYRDHIVEYTEPAKVRLREIVVRFDEGDEVEAGRKARMLLQDIQQGADFAEIARMHSDSNSREAGGDLGFFEQRELTDPLAEVAFQLGPGEISDVIRMEKSFYILQVEEKTEEKTLVIDDVAKDISEAIFRDKLREQTDKYMRRLRERAIIEINL